MMDGGYCFLRIWINPIQKALLFTLALTERVSPAKAIEREAAGGVSPPGEGYRRRWQ